MRILFFIDNLGFGGKERRLLELLIALDKMPEMELHLVLAKDQIVYKEIHNTGVKIHLVLREGLKKDPRVFIKFYRLAKQLKPDLIHVWGNLEAIYSLPAKIFLSIPLINSQIANTITELYHPLLNHRLTFPFADRIIGNSKAGLMAYKAPENKSRVIYNGFDSRRVQNLENPVEIRKEFGLVEGCIIGMVASFAQRKDYSTFMKAINSVVEQIDNCSFLCIGDGDYSGYRNMLTAKARSKTTFLGHQDHVESLMQICDIGILTTKTEGIPNSILEFMALGKPVVVAGGGGCRELVEDGKNGYLLESGDVQGVVNSIISLEQDREKRMEFGQASKSIVENRFSIGTMVQQYIDEYNALTKQELK